MIFVFYSMKITDKVKEAQRPHGEVTFKAYDQNQAWLLPPTLGELIPAGHIVRLINDAIEGIDMDLLIKEYKGGGSSAYHPRMMIKVLVFAYIEKRYSSREIEKALRENICFMWLSGMQQPDHNTLNRFRNSQLKQTVKEVFTHVLSLLVKQGYVRLEEYYLDGTKMESVAGRYSFVWAKNVERYKGGLLDKIAQIIEQIELANQSVESVLENSDNPKQEIRTISDSVALEKKIEELNKKLAGQKGENKQMVRQIRKLENEKLPKLQSYEKQEEILGGRSSYSKTDEDATFMRTKDDHLKNGQLRPCYNIQMGTENQFIINYTLHQTPSDMASFIDHMNDTLVVLDNIEGPSIKRICADAGYGSEQNYEFLEQNDIESFVKYPGYYKERKGKYKKEPFHPRNLHYNVEEDYYVCPMGQAMKLDYVKTEKNRSGYEQQIHVYKAQRCNGCPLRGQCHKAKTDRRIEVNHRAAQYRKKAKDNLSNLWGIKMRKQRSIDTESVFGHIKQDRLFRRFLLTSLQGVSTETGLLAIAHNFKKWWTKMSKVIDMKPLPPAMEAKCAQNHSNHALTSLIYHLGHTLQTMFLNGKSKKPFQIFAVNHNYRPYQSFLAF